MPTGFRNAQKGLLVVTTLAVTASPVWAPGSGNNLLPDIPMGSQEVYLQSVVVIPDIVMDITNAGDGSGRLFLVSPQGVIRIFVNGQVLPTPFLETSASPPDRAMSGLAFHPDYANNGKFYVITGEAIPNPMTVHYAAPQDTTGSAFHNVLYEYRVDETNPDLADPATKRELLRVYQAHLLHNMDDLCFGGDGYLYISMGDGGTTREGTPANYNTTAQQTTNPFGAILRIDVDNLGTNGRYGIPTDNPFADGAGGNAPEICAWGVRNPWRISTDRATGEVYTGVNGDFTIEQIYRVEAGKNYGWDSKEGSFLWNPITGDATVDPNPDPQYMPPLAEYDHNNSTRAYGSVIGGFVYRGAEMPQLDGMYLCHDWVAGQLIGMDVGTGALELVAIDPDGGFIFPSLDICWGEDEDGELYIGRANGEVLKLTPVPTDVPRIDRVGRPGFRATPNPFRTSTRIEFEGAGPCRVEISIFDVRGRRVRTLRSELPSPCVLSIPWNGRADDGENVPAGVYTYNVKWDGGTATGKLTRVD